MVVRRQKGEGGSADQQQLPERALDGEEGLEVVSPSSANNSEPEDADGIDAVGKGMQQERRYARGWHRGIQIATRNFIEVLKFGVASVHKK